MTTFSHDLSQTSVISYSEFHTQILQLSNNRRINSGSWKTTFSLFFKLGQWTCLKRKCLSKKQLMKLFYSTINCIYISELALSLLNNVFSNCQTIKVHLKGWSIKSFVLKCCWPNTDLSTSSAISTVLLIIMNTLTLKNRKCQRVTDKLLRIKIDL